MAAERPLTFYGKNQVRQTSHTGHSSRSQDELIRDYFFMDPYTWTHLCWLTSKNLYQFCGGTGFSLEDLPRALNDRGGWRESGKSVLSRATRWWWRRCCSTKMSLNKEAKPNLCLFVCFGLWYINLCRLFNAKYIFIGINSSISNSSI